VYIDTCFAVTVGMASVRGSEDIWTEFFSVFTEICYFFACKDVSYSSIETLKRTILKPEKQKKFLRLQVEKCLKNAHSEKPTCVFLQNTEGSHKFAASPDDVPVSSSLRYFGENLLRK
jgi:hypothetical protein